jgi:hypothetical protein
MKGRRNGLKQCFVFLWMPYFPIPPLPRNKPKSADYGTVAVFEDLYANLWDLVEFSPGYQMKI